MYENEKSMKKGKNIWVINQVAGNPESGWGERHYYLSKKWIEDGYNVWIVSGSYNHMFKNFPVTEGQFTLENFEGTNFCWVKCPKYDPKSILRFYSMIVFALKILFLPNRKLGRPDSIIVSSMPIFPIFSGWLLKLRFSSKLIFEIRDLWPLTPIHLMNLSRYNPMIMLIAWLEKLGYRKSDFIVSLLPNSFNYINSISRKPEKFRWIPNGISQELMVEEALPNEIVQMIPRDKFIIGYTGTMGIANALNYLVDAARLLKGKQEIHFVLVGDGYRKPYLEADSKNLNNITFIPKISKNQVNQMLQYFDVCFIGRNNTKLFDHGVSSNKYFDYMLAKKPILVSSNGIKCPVELANAGLIVNPESGKDIMNGILELFNATQEERNEYGSNGFKYVKKNHIFSLLSDKYSSLF